LAQVGSSPRVSFLRGPDFPAWSVSGCAQRMFGVLMYLYIHYPLSCVLPTNLIELSYLAFLQWCWYASFAASTSASLLHSARPSPQISPLTLTPTHIFVFIQSSTGSWYRRMCRTSGG